MAADLCRSCTGLSVVNLFLVIPRSWIERSVLARELAPLAREVAKLSLFNAAGDAHVGVLFSSPGLPQILLGIIHGGITCGVISGSGLSADNQRPHDGRGPLGAHPMGLREVGLSCSFPELLRRHEGHAIIVQHPNAYE